MCNQFLLSMHMSPEPKHDRRTSPPTSLSLFHIHPTLLPPSSSQHPPSYHASSPKSFRVSSSYPPIQRLKSNLDSTDDDLEHSGGVLMSECEGRATGEREGKRTEPGSGTGRKMVMVAEDGEHNGPMERPKRKRSRQSLSCTGTFLHLRFFVALSRI